MKVSLSITEAELFSVVRLEFCFLDSLFKSLGYLPLPVEDKITSHTADQPQMLNESQFIFCRNNSSPLSEYNT